MAKDQNQQVADIYTLAASAKENLLDSIKTVQELAFKAEAIGGVISDALVSQLRSTLVPALENALSGPEGLDTLMAPVDELKFSIFQTGEDLVTTPPPAPIERAPVDPQVPPPAGNGPFEPMRASRQRKSLRSVTRENWRREHPDTPIATDALDFRAISESYNKNALPGVFSDSKKKMREMFSQSIERSTDDRRRRISEANRKAAPNTDPQNARLEDWKYLANSTDLEINKYFK